jgi:hypothetical protein
MWVVWPEGDISLGRFLLISADLQASKYLIVVSSRAGLSFQSPYISHEAGAILRFFAAHQAWIAL